jgi:hypothetical protein
MICQSWKVMFQAEYSSGQPLRMLVDLRASVEAALGRGTEVESGEKAAEATTAAKADPAKTAAAKTAATKTHATTTIATKNPAVKFAPLAAAAAAIGTAAPAKPGPIAAKESKTKFAVANDDAPEFEVSAAAPEWAPEDDSQPGQKK